MTTKASGSRGHTGSRVAASPNKELPKSQEKTAAKSKRKNQAETEMAKLKEQLAEAIDARTKAEEARDEARKAQDKAEAARRGVEKQLAQDKPAASDTIPRPRAREMSEGANRLRKAMGLTDDKAKYLAIQSTICDLVHQVRLDLQLAYRLQPTKDLGTYSRCFQNDWATAELVKQYLSNRRKSDSRKRWLLSKAAEQAKKHRRVDKATSGDEDSNEGADADDENGWNEGSGEGSERESEG